MMDGHEWELWKDALAARYMMLEGKGIRYWAEAAFYRQWYNSLLED